MYNHADETYQCPICVGIDTEKEGRTLIEPSDIVFQDELVTAYISTFNIKNNPYHVIIVPNEHIENIYDMPDGAGARIQSIARELAITLKNAYKAQGITIIQNNEPYGGQHAFHYHMHVIPRYAGDELCKHIDEKPTADIKGRAEAAQSLRGYLGKRI